LAYLKKKLLAHYNIDSLDLLKNGFQLNPYCSRSIKIYEVWKPVAFQPLIRKSNNTNAAFAGEEDMARQRG